MVLTQIKILLLVKISSLSVLAIEFQRHPTRQPRDNGYDEYIHKCYTCVDQFIIDNNLAPFNMDFYSMQNNISTRLDECPPNVYLTKALKCTLPCVYMKFQAAAGESKDKKPYRMFLCEDLLDLNGVDFSAPDKENCVHRIAKIAKKSREGKFCRCNTIFCNRFYEPVSRLKWVQDSPANEANDTNKENSKKHSDITCEAQFSISYIVLLCGLVTFMVVGCLISWMCYSHTQKHRQSFYILPKRPPTRLISVCSTAGDDKSSYGI